MQKFFSNTILFFLVACNQPADKSIELQLQVDSLQHRMDNAYRPGLGEFMSSIQMHHAKLWFAGKNGNWELANFEMGEIQESIENIQKYNRDRPEINSFPMIIPALDSVKLAITQKNTESFKSSFILLTNTCNNCHRVSKHAFNLIRIPNAPPATNQVFEKQ